ncbi:PSD1 and planctomycete cytochrome C domain-containing protein [Alienimonas chondri]|uniref:DUF1549 domain-containing protein n=1 Tax=Alienimonas chondri TaxID=2681879 RepID=A0ABX1VCU8_9PLAN|nr:PSD1 and planctomycete cytochrome C domain-containing protein [Alienimonas chondri]NNJ25781.1 hypothetical protein [Alienimonas chondri]
MPFAWTRSGTIPRTGTIRRGDGLLKAIVVLATVVCVDSADRLAAGPPEGVAESKDGPGEKPVDFAHQIVPILRAHCVACHGGDEAKGGFSIDTRESFLDGGMADPGSPDFSHFLTLVVSRDPDLMMPPPEKDRVPAADAALLRRWVQEGMAWEAGFQFGEPGYEPPLRPRRVALPPAVDGRTHPIDRLIDGAGVPASEPADDATFLRRASLDLVGLLPTADQAEAFLADPSPDKRERLVDDLLAREIDYADHWLTFWNDLLRNDYAGTGFITKGRTQISGWLYRALRENKPYDAMVRELVAPADDGSAGFINGIEWRGTVSAGQTLPIQFSQSVSQSLLGINMKCASCHDSFIDRWTLADAYGLAAIYSEKPLELYRCDQPTGRMAGPAWPFPEIGQVDGDAPRDERLRQLGDLLTHPENGRVPRTIVNRLWAQLMGRGIVHPLDAMQTEPWNADLLDWLAADFQDHGYDLKRTLRLIATSEAYRSRSLRLESDAPLPEAGSAVPLVKRLTAEHFVDAVWQLTGTAPVEYDAPVDRRPAPEDEPAEPAEPMTRAALLASDALMRSLGRPNRDQIVTSRPSEVSTLEALDLNTSEALVANLRVGAERMLAASPQPSDLVDDLFLSALTRRPTEEERALIGDYLGPAPDADALTDVMWALLMKPEFLLIR